MPFIKVWIHYVWATKSRSPLLTDDVRPVLFDHMKQNAVSKKIYPDRINGYADHVHCLISLSSDQTIEKLAQLLKSESSYWLNNKSGLKLSKFQWQDEYFAVSVSESSVNIVRNYIDNQVIHHQKKSFAEEYEEFINKYGFTKFG